jgi:predicted metal-dependent HD superfamily phosphohydrolase
MSVTLADWHRLWRDLGCARGDEALFGRLVAAWSEPQRHYHTLQHLRECLVLLDDVRGQAARPAEVELALWFHDAVYEPTRHDNEERSADQAREAMHAAGLDAASADRVHALVMDTRHAQPPAGADAQLLVDIDLAILGAPAQRFDESDAQIRREYAHVGEAQWREGRTRVLRSFLERPAIYSTAVFHAAREAQARANLQRALQRLSA